MAFLNSPLFWVLAPLVGLPLLIHLLNKRFPRLFHFSSVQHLRETVAQQSRLYRWRHLILLLLRSVFVILLLLIFLKPVWQKFGGGGAGPGQRHVLLLFDHSLSMEYKGESITSRQRAVLEAEKIIGTLGNGDWLNVVLVGQSPVACFVGFSENHPEAKRFLNALKPGLTRADFSQANAAAARLLAKVNGVSEIYYLSDFQRKSWANVDFTPLPPNARLFFVDVSSRVKNNWAILGATINQGQILAGDTVPLEVTVGNYSDQPFQDRLTVLLDQHQKFERDCYVAPWSSAKVTLPIPPGAPGLHRCEISLPPDGLELDNHFCLSIPVLEKEEILIVSDDPATNQDAAFYLKTALNPYEQLQGSLLPKNIRSAELSASRLAGVKKLFLTRANLLTEESCLLLARFLFNGGGMIYFLDGKADAQNLVQLERAIGPGTMPIKLAGRHVAENLASGAQQILKGDFKSRFLKPFRGAMRQNLALLEFYDFYQASSTGAGNILLTYADDTPAMAGLNHGLGTLLLMNFSVSELSSNLARQRIFPAWIQELIKNLNSDEPVPASFPVGEIIQTEVWRNELRDNDFKGPNGEAITVKREVMGERFGVSFLADQLGFYTLATDRLLYAFGVNPSPEEADLRSVDKDVLPTQSTGATGGHLLAGQEDYENLVVGKPIFHLFVLAGLGILIVELCLQMLFRRLGGK
jgi:hypothetical protein